ncbi:imidazole glycerol phosphate synthase subunit HisH [Candidatus Saganbacteria bacterium]|nr:imidazole glycerol phosphate synthase subunit HisH [Candidatus Saganbacteria bacterium]
MPIAIINYGAGNLRSVEKAFEKLGFHAEITKDNTAIKNADGIVLPGVGAFDAAMSELRKENLEKVIFEVIGLGKPFLGICLGYQMLFDSSEEGNLKGFGILKGQVKRFDFNNSSFVNLSVPHMGWNRLLLKHRSPIFSGIISGSMVYFAHSFYPVPVDDMIISSSTDYGIEFASSVSKGNIFGIQFHPEKSGEVGLKILKNFGALCSK